MLLGFGFWVGFWGSVIFRGKTMVYPLTYYTKCVNYELNDFNY